MFELITGEANRFIDKPVWCNNSTYFVDGVSYNIKSGIWKKINPDTISGTLRKYKAQNSYEYFNKYIDKFIKANHKHFKYIRFEAMEFIRNVSLKYKDLPKYISFSGGKDSTVTGDLVVKALGNPSILHTFCDTTLEYPFTLEYIEALKKANSKYIIKTIKNREHEFYNLCSDIGVPSVNKRWCCVIFKSGISSKFLNQFFPRQEVIAFSGLRSCESNIRKNYMKIGGKEGKRKIQNQIIVSPILNWKDIDVWLYILAEQVLFNKAYRLGFSRVGCWCFPNSTNRGDALVKIYMKNQYQKWYEFLIKYAKKIGKDNPENYIKTEKWKLSRGGEGLKSSKDVKVEKRVCTTDEYSKIYKLNKLISDDFYMLFTPFGEVSKELGRKIINEVLILKNKLPIISICPIEDNSVKMKTMNVKNHKTLQSKLAYQVLKFNACRRCRKCESVCSFGAISIRDGSYKINGNICSHCLSCVDSKRISYGCIMKDYLKSKEK